MPKGKPPESATVDTSAWIAAIQNEPDRAEHVRRLLEGAAAGERQIYFSALTRTEITKGPKAEDPTLSDEQERTLDAFFEHPYVTEVSVDPIVARRASELRKRYPRLKTPDAVVLATALLTNSTALYTYDKRDLIRLNGDKALPGLRIEEPPVEHQTTLALE